MAEATAAISADSLEVLQTLKDYEVQLCKPIKSVGRYALKSDRGEGSMGSLFLTNIRLYFVNYTDTYQEVNDGKLVPPFEIHSFLDDASSITRHDDSIDFINVYKIHGTSNPPSFITLKIYCNDFRKLQFSLKDSTDVRSFIELLHKLIPSHFSPSSANMISSAGQMGKSILSTTNNSGKLPSMSKPPSMNTLRTSESSSNVQDQMSQGNFNYIPQDMEKAKMYLMSNKSPLHTASSLSEQMVLPSAPKRILYELPILWYLLSTQYAYSSLSDWETKERYWLKKNNNNYLRITLCNDSYQLSQTLPRSFVTLASTLLSDVTLLKSISNQLPCQRVPVICFAYYYEPAGEVDKNSSTPNDSNSQHSAQSPIIKFNPITKEDKFHLLLRSVTLTEDVRRKLKSYIIPLAFFDVTSKLPSFSSIEKSYAKLHETCASKSSSSSNFISNSGKWLKKVHLVLSAVKSIVKMITNESSVVLLEETDRCWNPLISSLVQICIDPDRRTIKGFEALIAKEWLYLTGNSNKYPDAIKPPSNVMFTLFVDCVHQLLSYEDSFNGYSFEFTSLYLVRLFDLSFLPSNFQAGSDLSSSIQPSFSSLTTAKLRGLTSSFEDLAFGSKSPKSSTRRRLSLVPKDPAKRLSGFTSYTNPTQSPTPPPRKNRPSKPSKPSQHSLTQSVPALRLTQSNGTIVNPENTTQTSSSLLNLALPLTIDGLTGHQLLFYFNPLFDGGQQIILKIPTCIASIIFFDALYLRWHRSVSSSTKSSMSMSSLYYSMFPILQQICLTQLHAYRTSCGLEESASVSNGHAKFVRLRSCGDTSSRSLSCANSIDSSLDYSETEL